MKSQILKHEKCIAIIEAIHTFEKRKKRVKESIDGYAGTFFHNLSVKYSKDLDTIDRCIVRLNERYKKAINEM